jgi:hypothetical protein
MPIQSFRCLALSDGFINRQTDCARNLNSCVVSSLLSRTTSVGLASDSYRRTRLPIIHAFSPPESISHFSLNAENGSLRILTTSRVLGSYCRGLMTPSHPGDWLLVCPPWTRLTCHE